MTAGPGVARSALLLLEEQLGAAGRLLGKDAVGAGSEALLVALSRDQVKQPLVGAPGDGIEHLEAGVDAPAGEDGREQPALLQRLRRELDRTHRLVLLARHAVDADE